MLGKDYAGQDCTLARALEVVGERWTLLILRDAFLGVQRFGEFAAHLDIPRAVLADRLSGLVDNGLLERRPDEDRPSREIYVLTPVGRQIWPALHALTRFGDRFTPSPGRMMRYVHAVCGTRLDPTGRCTTCDTTPPPTDVATRPARGEAMRDDPVTLALDRSAPLMHPIRTTRASPTTMG